MHSVCIVKNMDSCFLSLTSTHMRALASLLAVSPLVLVAHMAVSHTAGSAIDQPRAPKVTASLLGKQLVLVTYK